MTNPDIRLERAYIALEGLSVGGALSAVQERMVELETQVADAQEHANRLSTALSQLEASGIQIDRPTQDQIRAAGSW